jgi:hypothetical protein
MKYKVLDSFKAQTDRGEMELQPGQVITLLQERAIRLLNEGKITPLERVTYKVFSEILQAHLWIVETGQDRGELKSKGIKESIYSNNEIKELKGLYKDSLKEIHKIKEVFENSKIEEVKPKGPRT